MVVSVLPSTPATVETCTHTPIVGGCCPEGSYDGSRAADPVPRTALTLDGQVIYVARTTVLHLQAYRPSTTAPLTTISVHRRSISGVVKMEWAVRSTHATLRRR